MKSQKRAPRWHPALGTSCLASLLMHVFFICRILITSVSPYVVGAGITYHAWQRIVRRKLKLHVQVVEQSKRLTANRTIRLKKNADKWTEVHWKKVSGICSTALVSIFMNHLDENTKDLLTKLWTAQRMGGRKEQGSQRGTQKKPYQNEYSVFLEFF